MKHLAILLLLLAAAFVLGYRLGVRSVDITETTRIDTVYYEKPEPVRVLPPTFARVKVPRLVFARDTVFETVVVPGGGDSVELAVRVEHRQYGDSTYRAQVSGPRIGALGPSLDWIETYNRTATRSITRRNRFAVTLGAGVGYTPQGLQPMAGVQVGVVLWGF